MSITTEIKRIKDNISNAYEKLNEKGATIPTSKDSSNLVSTIDTISGGENIYDYFPQEIEANSIHAERALLLYIKKIPQIDISNVVGGTHLFSNFSGITEFPQMDYSNIEVADYMFNQCDNLQKLENINLNKTTSAVACFNFDRKLHTIINLNISSIVSDKKYDEWDSPVNYIFCACVSLKNLSFVGSINVEIDFSYCSNLTHDSLINIINALATTNSTKSICLCSESLALLSDDEKAIATNKGWSIVEKVEE